MVREITEQEKMVERVFCSMYQAEVAAGLRIHVGDSDAVLVARAQGVVEAILAPQNEVNQRFRTALGGK